MYTHTRSGKKKVVVDWWGENPRQKNIYIYGNGNKYLKKKRLEPKGGKGEGVIVRRRGLTSEKRKSTIWCEEEEEEEQLCGVDPKEIIRNYTHTQHTPGRKEKEGRQAGLVSLLLFFLSLVVQSLAGQSFFLFSPVAIVFRVASLLFPSSLVSPACDLSRANHFVQIVSSFSIIFWDPKKKKSSTLFVCCNQKTP